MATFRYLQPRQPGGGKSSAQNSYQDDPNGVYIPGRANRMDARPRNVLYAPGTGPGTKRAGIRTGIVNRDGSTSPVSSMGYRTGQLSQPWPTSPPDPKNAGTGASAARAPAADAADDDSSNHYAADYDTEESAAPHSSTPRERTLNPNAPLVYNPISLDNPGGNFLMQGATIADSSYMPEDDDNAAPQASSDNEPPRKRIDARPRNNIYMPGTGPGTGRTAIRIGTVNRDGSATPVSSMGYATGPLSQSRPSSLPPPRQKPAAAPPGAPPARPSITATAGMEGTLKSSSEPFGSDPAQQKLQPPKPLTPAVIPSSITLPSSSQSATAPNAIHSGLEGTIQASTQQFGSQPGMPKPAPAPAAQSPSSGPDTLKTPTPKPPLGTTPQLDTKAPSLSLTPSLGGIPTLTPSTGLDTLGGSSGKPFGISTSSPSGALDVTGLKKRARGGPVRAGHPYLVGEEGPELIVPKQSGTVVPNHALQFSPLGKAPTQFPSPAGGYMAEPTSDEDDDENDEARNPAYDASFDEPHDDAADSQPHEASFAEPPADEAADTSPQTAPGSAARPTTGLMLRPRPMPDEYARQQQANHNRANRSPYGDPQADTPPVTHPPDAPTDQHGFPQNNRPPETAPAAAPATASRWLQPRQAPGARDIQQPSVSPSVPSSGQSLQQPQPNVAAPRQPLPGTTPPADGSNPAAHSQAVGPYQGQASDTMDEGRGASSNNVSVAGDTGALRPGRSADPDQPDPTELYKISEEMKTLLLARRAVYDKMKQGNMPISTDELTRLMELDYQRGLVAKNDLFGMTFLDLMRRADDAYLYHIEPNEESHPGYEGTRGSGFELVESPKPQYDNPHIKPMMRGKSDPYYSWEINYNVVGQWLRIAGYSKFEAAHFLAAWLAKSPSKWKSLNLDRQTWFWVGYNYADARQKGWHPAGHVPQPKPAGPGWVTPPPASYPSRPPERRRF